MITEEGNKIILARAQKEINNFIQMRLNAELRALQEITFERKLSDTEYDRFIELGNLKLEGKI